MATIVRTEKRKRGIIGKIVLLSFWLYNGLMVWWLVEAFRLTGEQMASATTEAAKTGTAAGSVLATGMILAIWAAGAVILGLLVLLTPARTVITETTRD